MVAPYARILAASIAPLTPCSTISSACGEGAWPDATATTRRSTTRRTGCRKHDRRAASRCPTYMAHHQGMSLLALDNAVNAAPMQDRFHADPRVQAAELLLQERLPTARARSRIRPPKRPITCPRAGGRPGVAGRAATRRRTRSARATHLLSNGSYTRDGHQRGRRLQPAPGRGADALARRHHADAWGSFIYLRDLDRATSGRPTYQPTLREPDEYDVDVRARSRDVAPRRRRHRDPHRGRRLAGGRCRAAPRLVDQPQSDRARSIEITSYVEVVLAPADADLAHPAFSNLFVETAAVPERDALICTRPAAHRHRPRSIWSTCSAAAAGSAAPTEYETDRARFVGRGRTLANGRRRCSRTGAAQRTPPARCSIRSSACASRCGFRPAAPRVWRSRPDSPTARDGAPASDREVSRSPGRRAVAGAGQHAQPDRAAASRADHRRDACASSGSPAGCSIGDPRLRSAEAIRANAAAQTRAVEIRHLGRPADPAAALERRSQRAAAFASC